MTPVEPIGRPAINASRPFATPTARIAAMKIVTALFVIVAFACAANGAEAKGCLKGAVVGGVAGHYAGHHGMLGAAAGCLYGRHRAKEQERQQQSQDNGNNGM
jgi:hypothetical protein